MNFSTSEEGTLLQTHTDIHTRNKKKSWKSILEAFSLWDKSAVAGAQKYKMKISLPFYITFNSWKASITWIYNINKNSLNNFNSASIVFTTKAKKMNEKFRSTSAAIIQIFSLLLLMLFIVVTEIEIHVCDERINCLWY
jgi:hypothetical protein